VRGGKQTLVCSRTVHSSTVTCNAEKNRATIKHRAEKPTPQTAHLFFFQSLLPKLKK